MKKVEKLAENSQTKNKSQKLVKKSEKLLSKKAQTSEKSDKLVKKVTH